MNIHKVTPVFLIPNIKKEAEMWKKLGFSVTAEVPHEDQGGFMILTLGSAEIMLQTRPSLERDLPKVAELLGDRTCYLFNDVSDLKFCLNALSDEKVVVEPRETFYGTREFFVITTSGEIVGFAQKI